MHWMQLADDDVYDAAQLGPCFLHVSLSTETYHSPVGRIWTDGVATGALWQENLVCACKRSR